MQDIPQERITDFCRRHHIRRLSVFGSRSHGNPRADSDLDVLVEFEPEHTPGLDFFGMQDELSQILGVNVDLNTPGFLSPYFRDDVLQHAELIYAQS
jgi:uncharacterized protein